jgi:hypothetical protein
MAETPVKRTRTSTVPANETKRQAFVRIANRRTENALSAIANLGSLASPTNYEYTEADWAAIFKHLEGELAKLQNRVKNPTAAVAGSAPILSE